MDSTARGVPVPTQGDKLPPYMGPKKRAAVPGFVSKVDAIQVAAVMPSGLYGMASVPLDFSGPMGIGDGMADMLNTALIDSQRFVVLERKDLKEAMDEITQSNPAPAAGGGIGSAGATTPPASLIDPTSAPQAGKMLGAQVLIRGALTELSYSKSESSAGGGVIAAGADLEKVSFTAICAIDLKVIEVETGRILDSVRAEGRAESKAKLSDVQIAGIHFGQQSFQASPLAKAIRVAIVEGVKQVCQRLDKIPWEARIASVADKDGKKTLYLNFGSDVGLKAGAELEIFHPGALVIDPQTRVVIGREDDVVIGKCTIRSATKTMTIANATSDLAVAIGDGIRLPVPTPP